MITSAATALNHLPGLFRRVDQQFGWTAGTVNLDLGSGPYGHATRFLRERRVANWEYDPHHHCASRNEAVLIAASWGGVDTVTISNVLNMLEDDAAARWLLRKAAMFLKPAGRCYIAIYEGDRTDRARPTARGFQRHAPWTCYRDEILCHFRCLRGSSHLLIATESRYDFSTLERTG
jgi:hypothetical protein